jgi:hypothetical protein
MQMETALKPTKTRLQPRPFQHRDSDRTPKQHFGFRHRCQGPRGARVPQIPARIWQLPLLLQPFPRGPRHRPDDPNLPEKQNKVQRQWPGHQIWWRLRCCTLFCGQRSSLRGAPKHEANLFTTFLAEVAPRRRERRREQKTRQENTSNNSNSTTRTTGRIRFQPQPGNRPRNPKRARGQLPNELLRMVPGHRDSEKHDLKQVWERWSQQAANYNQTQNEQI